MSISSVSISLQFTPQTIAVIVAVLVIFVILAGIAGTRHRRRRGRGISRRAGAPRGSASPHPKRKDHGLEVARRHGVARSPEWSRVEKEHLMHEPACVACGYRGQGVQVHHVKPFHLHPALELDPRNLITLCEIKGREHHLLIGHLDEWESYNVHVRDDVRHYHGKSALQIRADMVWQKAVVRRP